VTITRSIPNTGTQEEGIQDFGHCDCRPGFRICPIAQDLYAEVLEARREYVRLRRDLEGDGRAMGEAMKAHVLARRAYDRHVYGRAA